MHVKMSVFTCSMNPFFVLLCQSVGVEDVKDLIEDLEQAMQGL